MPEGSSLLSELSSCLSSPGISQNDLSPVRIMRSWQQYSHSSVAFDLKKLTESIMHSFSPLQFSLLKLLEVFLSNEQDPLSFWFWVFVFFLIFSDMYFNISRNVLSMETENVD